MSNETQSTACIGKSHTFTPPTATAVFVRWTTTWTAGDAYWYFDNVSVQEALPPCTGTPAPGATTGPSVVCAGANFTLGLTTPTSGSGVSYQWYADNGSGYAAVGGNTPTLTTSQSVATSYYCDVTCSTGPSTGSSSVLSVGMNAPTACYCTPTGAANNADEIRNFTLSNLNNNSAASEGTNGYMDYTGSVAAAQLLAGTAYTASLTSGSGTLSHGAAIWIDYNDNGVFEPSEKVAAIPSTIAASSTVSFPAFTTASAAGVHRLRVQYRYDVDGSALDPCVASTFSETEDYLVEVTLPSVCTTPAPGATTGPANACDGISFTLGIANETTESGISYQWYADDGSGPIAVGTDSPTYTTSQSVATDYYCAVTCSTGPSTVNSGTLSVGMNAPSACYCTPTGAANNADEIRNFTLGTLNNNSAASEGTAGYMDYTGTVAAAQLIAGQPYTASLTSGTGSGNHGAAIWIDYNDNGVFEPTEMVADLASTIGASATVSFPSFTAGAAGVHRLRVQYTYNQAGAGLDPCTITSQFAETEDYLVDIDAGTACTTPAPGATTGPASVCSGVAFTLGIANETTETGISYQWYADDGTGPVAVGTDASTYTTSQSVATDYYCAVTCSTGPSTVNSGTLSVGMNAPNACYCTPGGNSATRYINAFTTTGGTQNISNTASGYSAGGYGDFTALTVTQNALGTVDFTAIYSTGNYGLKIWVDWNQNGSFEDAGEVAYASSSYASTHSGTITVPVSATGGTTRMRIGNHFNSSSGPATSCTTGIPGEFEDYSFEVIAATACSGTPGASAITASVSEICAGFPFGLSGTTILESGITYQWQSAPAGTGTWVDITGATSTTFTVSAGITASTDYRLMVTCTNSSESTPSNVATVVVKPANQCYCTPGGNSTSRYINAFTTAGGTQNISNTASGYSAGGYGDFTAMTVTQNALGTVDFTAIYSTGTYGLKVWVDWNQNGNFTDVGEVAYSSTGYASSHTGTITVPLTATGGTTRMRIGNSFNTSSGASSPCLTSLDGEFEDYSFDVIPPANCAGTPAASTVTVSASEVCAEVPFNLTGTSIEESGITYQWQRSAAGAGSWSNVTGATSTNYTVSAGINASTDYRLVVTCTNSGESSNSNVASITLKPIVDCFCTPTISTTEPICNVTFAGINNTSPSTGGPGYQDFAGSVGAAAVDAGSSYVISATGNTSGNFTTYFTAFFDWDQDGTFETAVPMGSTTNNICVTAVSATVNVPQNAVGGTTRMRVIKNFNSSPTNACGSYSYGQAEDYLVNVTAFVCGEVVVNITTDNNPEDLSWEITDATNTVIASGAPLGANQLVSETVCLGAAPINGCYGFKLMDSFGDGIVGGGWELRTTSGKLLLQDEFASGSVSPSASPINPNYPGHIFCLPEGPANIAPTECGIFNNALGNKVYANKVIGASNYQFEFSDPDAGFMR
ncbi:MAG: GEVED domain-containing protein, partial [Flavobacteriales bacterium]